MVQSFFHDPHQALTIFVYMALVCLILAVLTLSGSFVVLYRARKNFVKSIEDLHKAQEMRTIWENEKHRFSRPTCKMPEDYYAGYEKSPSTALPSAPSL